MTSDPTTCRLTLPAGSRALVVSDLQLTPTATESSEIAVALIAKEIDRLGHGGSAGAVILAGDVLDLTKCDHLDPGQAMAAHPRFLTALRRYGALGPGHHVVMLAGELDVAILDHGISSQRIEEYGFERAARLELVASCGSGERRLLIEHGHRFASEVGGANSIPGSPRPQAGAVDVAAGLPPGWLVGADDLLDRTDKRRFTSSRFLYRRILGPVGAAVSVTVTTAVAIGVVSDHAGGRYLASGLLAVAALVSFLSSRAVGRSTRNVAVSADGSERDTNRSARSEAERLAAVGWHGLITGYSRRPELTDLGGGRFYANCGAAVDGTVGLPARFGFPTVFCPVRQTSWVELESAAELQVRLVVGRSPTPGASLLETLVRRSRGVLTHYPTVMAELPSASRTTPATWPGAAGDVQSATLRVRRRAGAGLAVAGVLNIVLALTPPVAERLQTLTHWVSLTVAQTATGLTTLVGLGLLLLARGVRRGQRRAWLVASALLALSTVLHVLKGLDTEEAVATAILFGYLAVHQGQFRAPVDRTSTRRAIVLLFGVVTASIAFGIAATRTEHGLAAQLPLPRVAAAVLERLIGNTSIHLDRSERFLDPALAALGFGSIAIAAWMALRPRRPANSPRETRESSRAHGIVGEYGRDTLAYFALRDDKQWFFQGESLVAYTVRFGVCLVSPDPVGPLADRDDVWAAFTHFAHSNGWTVAVMGAATDWLAIYHSSGFRDLYIGDEAVVDCRRFTLDGSHNKGLRNSVNKISRKGYRVEFLDPSAIEDSMRQQLVELMAGSRRGEVERGFSMTLGRVFDPRDRGLLLAVCVDVSGRAVAFCQYTPASGIDGYSLDLMRRSESDTTNGLTDFVVVETIRHLTESGHVGLGLNFATMRAVVAGEINDSPISRVQRWTLSRLSSSMQIESLWRYNAKFDPEWCPRYAVFESLEHLLPAALAVASVESWWELPLIGRFLVSTPSSVGAGQDRRPTAAGSSNPPHRTDGNQ